MRIHARRVSDGIVRGKVAKSTAPLSFLGELDANTGKVENPQSELNGRSVTGTVLVFPEARGSTVGPYVLYGAAKRGTAPLAMVVGKADAIVASAAVLANLPCVSGVDVAMLHDGEEVIVNGAEGSIEIPHVEENRVVTSLLQNEKGQVLLLKQPGTVRTYEGKWGGISGRLEDRDPVAQAYEVVEAALGLRREDLSPVGKGAVAYAREGGQGFVIHAYLFRTSRGDLRAAKGYSELAWVDPLQRAQYPAVAGLDRAITLLLA